MGRTCICVSPKSVLAPHQMEFHLRAGSQNPLGILLKRVFLSEFLKGSPRNFYLILREILMNNLAWRLFRKVDWQ